MLFLFVVEYKGRSRSPSPMGTGKRHLDSPGFAHADQVKVNKTQDNASMVYTDKVIKTQPSPTLTHVDKAKKTQPSPTLTYVDKAKKTKHSVAAEISKNKNRLKANARIKSFFFLWLYNYFNIFLIVRHLSCNISLERTFSEGLTKVAA